MKRVMLAVLCLAVAVTVAACGTTPRGGSDDYALEQRRQAVKDMRQQVLADLYRVKPSVQAQVAAAPGYAVFSNANINVIFASFSGGRGIVRDNRTGRDTYMKMGELGLGLGWGIKDFRAVFVFHDAATMQRFIDQGWEFGAHADAAAQAGSMGGSVGGEIVLDNITIYQMTEAGLALQATVKGTRYWMDDELN